MVQGGVRPPSPVPDGSVSIYYADGEPHDTFAFSEIDGWYPGHSAVAVRFTDGRNILIPWHRIRKVEFQNNSEQFIGDLMLQQVLGEGLVN